MKRFWPAIFLLVGIFALCLYNARYARQLTGTLAGQLRQAQTFAQLGQWDSAGSDTKSAHARWQKARFFRCVLASQGQTDRISSAFHKVARSVQQRELSGYIRENEELIMALELLGEWEQPSLLNIL